MLTRAWDLARTSGTYTFHTSIDQQTSQIPSLRSVGRPPRHDYLSLRGTIDQPAKRMALQLWRSRSPEPVDAVQVAVNDGQVQGRVGSGQWQPVDLDVSSFAPGGDPLGFLAGASNVQQGATETRDLGGQRLTFTSTTFTINGRAFASYLQDKVVPQMREQGKLPPWLSVDMIGQYESLAGSGQLLVDADGLPARLQLDLQLPTPKQGGSVRATVITDYSTFDRQRLALSSTPFVEQPVAWITYRLGELQTALPALRDLATKSLAILIVVGLVVLIWPHMRRRSVYRNIVLLVIASMLMSPLMQAQQVAAFSDKQQHIEAQQSAQVAKANALESARATIKQNTIDPHQQPSVNAATITSNPAAVQSSAAQTSTTDSDGDGLTDADEADWGSCPSATSTSASCSGVTDPTDSDGDGLGDNVEVAKLGTLPGRRDSDGDTIADNLEVKGFSYNGKTWYLNPSASDSNNDGLTDSAECEVWVSSSSRYNPSAACPDTDGDGTPDVWDTDNDNDGVIDSLDLDSSTSVTGFTSDTPLDLSISSLTTDKPVFVDLQLRPTTKDHLGYINSVLDWPSGDTEGQIQRRLDTTFATTANSSLQSSDANAGNGDLRLVPMVEITIPYQAGSYANLPVKTAYKNVTRTTSMRVADWLDTDKLDPYGITVRDADTTSGELVAYVPLSAVVDTDTGMNAAFSARMLYWPSQSSWGTAQEFRVVWLVQMLTDECVDSSADTSTCARQDTLQVIHTYDEDWSLTGMAVREDWGLNVNILYEDPTKSSDPARANDLWNASWNLNNTWLRGRDCDSISNSVCQSNGSRDVTTSNMLAKIHTWSSNSDPIKAVSKSYDHQGYLSSVMSTDAPNLLNTTFSSASEATLLFAREETFRSANLSDATVSGYNVSLAMTTAIAPELVQAFMSWSRYQKTSGSWSNYDSSEDIQRLKLDLKEQSYFQTGSDDEIAGKKILAQSYYSSMLNGVSSVVEGNGQTTWTSSSGYDGVSEISYEVAWPPATFSGAGTTVSELATKLVSSATNPVTGNTATLFEKLASAFDNPNATSSFTKHLNGAVTGSNVLMDMSVTATVFGLTLFAVGYFTGDTTALEIGTSILNATTVVMSTVWASNIIYGMYKTTSSLYGATRLTKMAEVASANRAVGSIGLLLGVAATWGLFVYSGLTSGMFKHTDSITFNTALALAIATTLVLLILFIVDLIPLVGPLIVSVIYIIDSILSLACDCTGVQAWLTQTIAKSLYDIDYVITNFGSTSRFDYNVGFTYSNPDAGFTTANGLIFTVDVTNTLKYGSDNSVGDARKATVKHSLGSYLKQAQTGDMTNDWTSIGGRKIQNVEHLTKDAVPFSKLGTGINKNMHSYLDLRESYALPYRGCWEVAGIKADCNSWQSTTGSTTYNLGKYYTFDILPTTLTAFYALTWNSNTSLSFPTQLDHDGDGLTYWLDPNDLTWDADGDGVADYTEITLGTNTSKTDSDGDGLDDATEIRNGTSPTNADSDNDGLSDATEAAGWLFAYATVNGKAQYTRVWSDPYDADTDADGLSDLQEYNYGLNPRVAIDSDDLLNTVSFANASISEQKVPLTLMRFEETNSSAQVFADSSGHGHLASCDSSAGACPTAAVTGRYNNGVSFDGDDMLTLDDESDFDLNIMSLSAWVKIDSFTTPWQAIIAKGGDWGIYRYGSTNNLTFHTNGLSNVDLTTSTAIADGKWHYLLASFNGSRKNLSIDGQQVAIQSTTGTISTNNSAVTIGGDAANTGRGWIGSIDDVAIYDVTDISDIRNGKYAVQDNVVAPGSSITAKLQVTNSSSSSAAAVTYYGETDDNFSGYTSILPSARWKLDETSGVTSFANVITSNKPASCATGSCPTSGVSGYRNNAVELGSTSVIKLDNGLSGSFTNAIAFGGWVYPTGGGTNARQRVFALQSSDSSDISSLLDAIYYNRDTQKFWTTLTEGAGSGSAALNQWHHVMLVYDRLSSTQFFYVDGALVAKKVIATANAYDPSSKYLRVGDPISTNDLYINSIVGFLGKVDDLAVYNGQVLTAAQIVKIMADTAPQQTVEPTTQTFSVPAASQQTISSSYMIPSTTSAGSFSYSQVAEAALKSTSDLGISAQPLVQVHFDEQSNLAYSGFGPDYFQVVGCTNCPTYVSDFAGQAAEFDGVNDQLQITAPVTSTAWTVGVWFNPTWTDSVKHALFGRRDSGTNYVSGGFPSLYVTSDKKLSLMIYTNSAGWREYTPSGAATLTFNRWQQATLTYDGSSTYTIYLDGQVYGTVTASAASISSPVYLGAISSSYSTFKGRMDNFTVYNAKLSATQVQALSSQTDLALHAHYTFDEAPGSTTVTDLAGIFGDATCTSCPRFGLPSDSNRAALFDGTNLLQSANKPSYWRSRVADYSVAAWVRVQNGTIIEAKGLNQPLALWNDRLSGGYAGSSSATGHSYYKNAVAFEQQPSSEWMQIVAVYDYNGSNGGVYINGEKVISADWTASSSPASVAALLLGNQLTGYLDDVRVYNRALSSSDVSSLYATTTPVLQFAFDESYNATSFADSSSNGYDGVAVGATSGNAGRVGNGVTLDGSSYVKLASATNADSIAANATLMAWVKPDSLGTTQTIIATNSAANTKGMRLSLTSSGYLQLTNGSTSLTSSSAVSSATWSHVAVVVSQNSKATFYINGVNAGGGTLSGTFSADSDGVVTIGARTANGGSSFSDYFSGKLDELAAYGRALSYSELKSIYNDQYFWYRNTATTTLSVDTAAPTITVLNSQTYWSNDQIQLAVSTIDSGSTVMAFDYTIKFPSGRTLTQQTAQQCSDSVNNNLWCVVIDPDSSYTEGTYTLTFRAVDAVGNESYSTPHTIYLDKTGPAVTINDLGNHWITPTSSGEQSWTYHFAGTLSDPQLTSSLAGVGIDSSSVKVSLLDASGATVADGPVVATVSGSTWSVDYEVTGVEPSGWYTLKVEAADLLGTSASKTDSVRMDVTAPSIEVSTSALPDDLMSSEKISGYTSDFAMPADNVAAFHFTETAGATSFAGNADGSISATCTACPTRTDGPFLYGQQFNGSSAKLTVPATDTLALSSGSFAAWIYPTWSNGAGSHTILALSDGSSTRYDWRISGDYKSMELFNGTSTLTVPVTLEANTWAHVALVQNGTSWTGYVNGVSVGSATQAFGSGSSLPLQIGAANSGQFFNGRLDEVLIFDRALGASEIYPLGHDDVAGGVIVEIGLQPFDFDNPPSGDTGTTWYQASMGNTLNFQTAWWWTMPSNMEGFYQVRLRATDSRNNQRDMGVIWRGGIDTLAPRITYTDNQVGGKYSEHIDYTVDIDDLFYDPSTLDHPCASVADTHYSYTYYSNPKLIKHATISCTRIGNYGNSFYTIQAADYSGHTTKLQGLPRSVWDDEVLITAPTATNALTVTVPVSITGKAYSDYSQIRSITVKVDGLEIGSQSSIFAKETEWAFDWTPTSPGSHTIQATMDDVNNRSFTTESIVQVKNELAPGGVGDDLGLWMKANADTTTASDGESVTSWRDHKNGWIAQHSADLTPTLALDAINFNPALTFGANGASEMNLGEHLVTAEGGSSGMTIFVVADPAADTGSDHLLLDTGSYPNAGYGLAYSANQISGYAPGANTSGSSQIVQTTPITTGTTLVSYRVAFGSGSQLALDGATQTSTSNTALSAIDSANLSHSTTHQSASGPFTIGRQAQNSNETGRYFRGKVAEVIVYGAALTDAQRQQVESYLAIKYGITLDQISYRSADGSVLWDATAQADFNHHVAGIGRDDDSALDQPKSRSIDDGLVTISNGNSLSAPTSLISDTSFLLWGDDNGSLTNTTHVTSGTLSYERMARTWQVRETGSVGTVQVAFDTGKLSDIAPLPFLLVSSDRGFSNPRFVAGTLESGQVVYSVDLGDGEFFTLATNHSDTLDLVITGNGAGTVSSEPAGITCSASCTNTTDYRAAYTLTANPTEGSLFSGWSGACSGTGTCDVTVDALDTITATFTLKQFTVTVTTMHGQGVGEVVSDPAGMRCRSDCSLTLNYGSVITMTATPLYGATFHGWGGDCSGTAPCVLTVTDNRAFNATFDNTTSAPYGRYAWPVPGIFQAEDFDTGGQGVAYLDLDANTNSSRLYRSVTEEADISVKYGNWVLHSTFANEWINYTVDVAKSGLYGFQARVANPGYGASLYLVVDGVRVPGALSIPNTGSWSNYQTVTFSGVSLNAGYHVVTIFFEKNATSYFVGDFDWFGFVSQESLTVAKTGDGSGTVVSSVSGISCGSDCSESYDLGTSVTLTATASLGSNFAGWDGACSGTGTCSLTLDQSRAVTATFTLNNYALTVSKTGDGSGTVSSTGGIDCGSTCSATLPYGTVITLTATANVGTFTGWSGACVGTGDCAITIGQTNIVTATFLNQYWLHVTSDGNGSGLVTSEPDGIRCGVGGQACDALFDANATVVLTATGSEDSDFAGWNGACSGTITCTLTLDAAKSATASFTRKHHDLAVVIEGNGQGEITSDSAGIDCGTDGSATDCSENLEHGSVLTLHASVPTGYGFGGWSGACSGDGDCVVTFDRANEVVAEFYNCTNFTVTTDQDMGPGSLRQALERACNGSTIDFDNDYTIGLSYGKLTIDTGVMIDGGDHSITLDARPGGLNFGNGGVLTIDSSEPVSINHLSFVHGAAWAGGGIVNNSVLTVTNSIISNNEAFGTNQFGGGIYNTGTLTVISSTVKDNRASSYGGGIYSSPNSTLVMSGTLMQNNDTPNDGGGVFVNENAHATITNSTFELNQGRDGAGISSYSSVTSQGNAFTHNSATSDGGAIYIHTGGSLASSGDSFSNNSSTLYGGGLMLQDNTSATVDGATFSGNSSRQGGAASSFGAGTALDVSNSSFEANSAEIFGGALILVQGSGTIDTSSFSHNTSDQFGGALASSGASLTIKATDVISNSADSTGGGIYGCDGTLTIIESTISDNWANPSNNGQGGGIDYICGGTLSVEGSMISSNRASYGGGLNSYEATVKISTSTFAQNSATGGWFDDPDICDEDCTYYDDGGNVSGYCATNCGPAPEPDSRGGAINSGSELTVSNSTISQNSADITGGGVSVEYNDATISNSTISQNSAESGGGVQFWGTLNLNNTIIAGSTTGGDCADGGLLGINTGNLIEDGSCDPKLSGDPLLAPLGNYGGATETQMLLPSSPAIDAADSANCATTDQRGVARPVGAACDIGAYEREDSQQQYQLNVSVVGNGSVKSNPAGIDCGSDCTELYDYGTTVTLSATPADGLVFLGWSGACSGTSTCTVTMYGTKNTTARFGMPPTATPTPSNTPVPSATPTPSATATATETATSMPSETATETVNATATETATSMPSETPTSSETAIETSTATAAPTATETVPSTPSATATASETATASASQTPTLTETAMPTATASTTPTATETSMPEPSGTTTPTPSETMAATPSETPIASATLTETSTTSTTATPTVTNTLTETPTPSATSTPSTSEATPSVPTTTATSRATATVTPSELPSLEVTSPVEITPTSPRPSITYKIYFPLLVKPAAVEAMEP